MLKNDIVIQIHPLLILFNTSIAAPIPRTGHQLCPIACRCAEIYYIIRVPCCTTNIRPSCAIGTWLPLNSTCTRADGWRSGQSHICTHTNSSRRHTDRYWGVCYDSNRSCGRGYATADCRREIDTILGGGSQLTCIQYCAVCPCIYPNWAVPYLPLISACERTIDGSR